MTFSITTFIVSWVSFIIFADKRKFFVIYPTCVFAFALALATDLLVVVSPLWEYQSVTKLNLLLKQFLNGLGIYFVVTYFFLQTIPKNERVWTIIKHIFYWSLFSIIFEWFAKKVGYIKHGLWWNLGWSYLSDWMLFLLFYAHHKWRINGGRNCSKRG